MSYKYFEAGLPMSKAPNERFKSDFDEYVKRQFANAYNWFTVEEEISPGSQVYDEIKVRASHVINPATGIQLSDDWRAFIFNIDAETLMGKRYKYFDNIWMTVNIERYGTPTNNCIVRRCNNFLTLTNQYGDIHKEPCIIDPSLKYGNIYFNNSVDIAQGTIKVWVQLNNYTKDIDINHRFIIGYSEVYKVKTVVNYLNDNTFDVNGSAIIELTMQLDSIQSGDNFDNHTTGSTPIITYDGLRKKITVTPDNFMILQGERKIYECYYSNNKRIGTDTFEFTVLENMVPSERYLFEVIDGNSFAITNYRKYSKYTIPIQCKNLINNEISTFNFTLGGEI